MTRSTSPGVTSRTSPLPPASGAPGAAELPPLEVAGRAARVRAALAGLEGDDACQALLVTDLVNVRWLTGFSGSNGWVVVRPDGMVLVTDGRYGEQATAQLAAHGVEATVAVGRTVARTAELLTEALAGFTRVGFEAAHTSVADHRRLAAGVTATLVPTEGMVERFRRTKDAGEVARIALACAIADAALADVGPMLAERPTEAQVRNALDARMRELGADGPSYDTIVASGPIDAARPHHAPGHAVVAEGHTVIVDVGALHDGYHSDMTRTFVVGEPSAEQAEVYAAVLAAQRAGVAAVRPGIAAAELDAVCRDLLTDAGLGQWFTHGTGHGVGLEIHEDPYVGSTARGVLQVGDLVTVEPGVYREGLGGVRVEDLVVVTTDGCRILTQTPKDTPCLPSRRTT